MCHETLKLLFSFSISISIFLLSLRLMSDSVQAVLECAAQTADTVNLQSAHQLNNRGSSDSSCPKQQCNRCDHCSLSQCRRFEFKQAFGVILGANIGTTITAQIAY